jgi:hypothetical protein
MVVREYKNDDDEEHVDDMEGDNAGDDDDNDNEGDEVTSISRDSNWSLITPVRSDMRCFISCEDVFRKVLASLVAPSVRSKLSPFSVLSSPSIASAGLSSSSSGGMP